MNIIFPVGFIEIAQTMNEIHGIKICLHERMNMQWMESPKTMLLSTLSDGERIKTAILCLFKCSCNPHTVSNTADQVQARCGYGHNRKKEDGYSGTLRRERASRGKMSDGSKNFGIQK